MDKLEITNELTNIIESYLNTKNLDLADLIYRYEGSDLVIRVLSDRPEGGITMGECSKLNREIGRILEEKNILGSQGYILEVSSPGLDRPLKLKKDFLRCLNKRVIFFLKEPVNGKLEFEGIINKADDNLVYINVKGSLIEIPINAVNKAKQVI